MTLAQAAGVASSGGYSAAPSTPVVFFTIGINDGEGNFSGQTYRSPNGTTTWSHTDDVSGVTVNDSARMEWLANVGSSGRAIMVQGAGITPQRSDDYGANWTSGSGSGPNAIGYNGSNMVVTGSTTGGIRTSPDGASWTLRTSGTSAFLRRVRYQNSLWVVCGDAVIVTATDPTGTWTTRDTTAGNSYQGTAYGASTHVAVGYNGSNNGIVYTSSDGTSWSSQTISATGIKLYDVAFGNSVFVAVGQDGAVYTSSNGTSWTARSLPGGVTPILAAVAWSPTAGVFVAGGSGSSVFSSTDGVTWVNRTSTVNAPSATIQQIAAV